MKQLIALAVAICALIGGFNVTQRMTADNIDTITNAISVMIVIFGIGVAVSIFTAILYWIRGKFESEPPPPMSSPNKRLPPPTWGGPPQITQRGYPTMPAVQQPTTGSFIVQDEYSEGEWR